MHRRTILRSAVAGTVLAATGQPFSEALAQRRRQQITAGLHGVCTHFRVNRGPWRRTKIPKIRQVIGCTRVRDGILFKKMRRNRPNGRTDFSEVQHVIDLLEAGHYVTLDFNGGHSRWGRGRRERPHRQQHYNIWADWVVEVLQYLRQRFPDLERRLAVEVFNEVPINPFVRPIYRHYVALLREVYDRVKDYDRNITVLGGAFVTWQQNYWSRQFVRYDGPRYCDEVVFHTYSRNKPGFYTTQNYIDLARRMSDRVGKPLAITEWRPGGRPPRPADIEAWAHRIRQSGVINSAHYYLAADDGVFPQFGLCTRQWRLKNQGRAWRRACDIS